MTENIPTPRTHRKFGHPFVKPIFTCSMPFYRYFAVGWFAAMMTLAHTDILEAQQPSTAAMINREHKIKAAYLYNFARYIKWPDKTFQNAEEPFVIGIVGDDPVRHNLEQLAKSRKVDGRPIEVKLFMNPKDVIPCQILFLSPSLQPEVQKQILQNLAGKNVLFVGQTSNFLNMGGVIDFVIHQNRIRLALALEAAQREKLKVSAKLIQVAQVVR